MIWLLVFLLILVSISCYLLFAPFYLEINSRIGLCRIRFHRLAMAGFYLQESSLILELKIAGWRKQIDLLAERPSHKENLKIKYKKERKTISLKKIKAILKSFKVNKLYLNFCFDNMPLNGILYPAFLWLSRRTGKHFEINFWNENEFILEIENNLFRMIRAYIKS